MKEGFELKSFCIRVEDLTEQEAADMLDRCVELGAAAYDGVKHNTPQKYRFSDYYALRGLSYIGIDKDMDTYLWDEQYAYTGLLDKQEMLDYLGLYRCGGRLLVKGVTVSKETSPNRVGIAFMSKMQLELYMEEPCRITVKGGLLEITPTSGESDGV